MRTPLTIFDLFQRTVVQLRTFVSFCCICSFAILSGCAGKEEKAGESEIMNWKDGKNGAISITYDDASINQFRQALPIMDTLDIKATFYINTAHISDNRIPPKFIGRPIDEIIRETATKPTDRSNLFERASAIRFTGVKGAVLI